MTVEILNSIGRLLRTVEAMDLRGANLQGADLRGANLCVADLRSADLRSASLQGADLRSADLRSAYLRGADLCCSNLCGADLQSANLRGANLQGADLRGADLRGANLQGADLRGADLGSQWIIQGFTRSDGYAFFLQQLTGDTEPMVKAGCRYFTIAEAQAHWEHKRAGTKLLDETKVIVRAMLDLARIRGLISNG